MPLGIVEQVAYVLAVKIQLQNDVVHRNQTRLNRPSPRSQKYMEEVTFHAPNISGVHGVGLKSNVDGQLRNGASTELASFIEHKKN